MLGQSLPRLRTPSSPPVIPATPSTKPASDDFFPLSFFGWTLAGVSLVGLVAWGFQSGDNMNQVKDVVHLGNMLLNKL